jgi:UDP-glucose 6-dehydrogenase
MAQTTAAGPVLVVGAGYVGLVTAVGLAGLGHRVHLVEIRRDRLESLRRGIPPIHEAGLPEALAAAVSSGALTVSAEPTANARIVVVCVGTPIGMDGRSDLSELQIALSGLFPYLGDLGQGPAANRLMPVMVAGDETVVARFGESKEGRPS